MRVFLSYLCAIKNKLLLITIVMRRRKVLLNLLCIFCFTSLFAQQKDINYGIQAGLTSSKMASLGYLPGINVGITAEKDLSKYIYMNTAICFTGKGGEGGIYKNDVKARANYLAIPIHIGLKQRLSDSFKLFEEIGPYFSYGIGGKLIHRERVEIIDIDKNESQTVIVPKEYETFSFIRRFNMGVGFRLGALYKDKYSLSFGSDVSTISIYKDESEYGLNLIINLGYVF